MPLVPFVFIAIPEVIGLVKSVISAINDGDDGLAARRATEAAIRVACITAAKKRLG